MERNTLFSAYAITGKIKTAGLAVSAVAVFITMLMITFDVIARNFTPLAVMGIYESVQNYAMPLMVFPAMAWTYSAGVLPRVTMAVDKLKPKARLILSHVIPLLNLVLIAILMLFSFTYANNMMRDRMSFVAGTSILPVWPLYYLPPIAFLLILVEDVFIAIRNFGEKRAKHTFEDRQESESTAT